MDTSTGRLVWHELMTTDTKAAIAFYTEVVGWTTQPFDQSADPYMMWVGTQGPLGGVYPLPEAAKNMGAPPHWMAHVAVPDVDEAVAKAKRMGGSVFVEPQDIPKVGRFAIIADPQGASISVFKSAETMAAHDPNKNGEFTWAELATTDHNAAFGFYSELAGWKKTGEFDMGPMGIYLMFGPGDKAIGGMMTKPKDAPMPTAWTYYIHVDDLDAAIDRAKTRSAKLIMGPMEVPGGERVAILIDPQGAAFALHGAALPKT